MEILVFLDKFLKMDGTSISYTTHHKWHWNKWYEFAEATGLIDFECQFDESGSCKLNRNYSRKYFNKQIKCCCGNCKSSVGFMDALPSNMNIIKKIASLFDEETGFWREKTGCILPRKYRSLTCLTYRCFMVKNETSDEKNKVIEDVMEILSTKNQNPSMDMPTIYRSHKIVDSKIEYDRFKKIPSIGDLREELKKVNKKWHMRSHVV